MYYSFLVQYIIYFGVGCSHCHDLAPTWRQLGSALAGVIGIGAVNCREQWMLCNQLGIQQYPTLLFFTDPGDGVVSTTLLILVFVLAVVL